MKKYLIIILSIFLVGCTNTKPKETSSTDKISSYLQKESEETFTKHYELKDFIISNYEETIVDNNTDAIFNYKIIYKNYDKDPDTVEYIKTAKENKDPFYQIYYDEYLELKELNFELKAIINNTNGEISLYSEKYPHGEKEWIDFKMSDHVLSTISTENPEASTQYFLTIDDISSYLQKESEETFTKHYEFKDFIISNYEEITVDNNTGAIFNYKIVYKNYDKDPDTVEYIKTAKENKDPFYQIYYDEYLELRELNFVLKAIMNNTNGEISLYSEEYPHGEKEWIDFKMSDHILE